MRDLPVMTRLLANILILMLRHNCEVVCLGELVYGGWLVFPLRYIFRRKVLVYTHGEEISQESENCFLTAVAHFCGMPMA